jgi:hypothetical protein
MTPQDFVRKWKPVALTERAAAYGWPEDISTDERPCPPAGAQSREGEGDIGRDDV